MKLVRSLARWGIGASYALTLSAAPMNIEFSGLDTSGGTVRVSLTHPETKQSAWLIVGQRFFDCEVRAYNAKKQTLTLARGAETWEIVLATSSTRSAALTAEETERITRQVKNNLRQIAAAADQYFLEQGVTTVRLDQLVGPDKYIGELKVGDDEDYSKLKLEQSTTPVEWQVVTRRGVTVRWTRN